MILLTCSYSSIVFSVWYTCIQTSRRTHNRMKIKSCSDAGTLSANSSCWRQKVTRLVAERTKWSTKIYLFNFFYLSFLLPGHTLALFNFMSNLSTQGTWSGFVRLELLTDDGEVGLMRCQTQHN